MIGTRLAGDPTDSRPPAAGQGSGTTIARTMKKLAWHRWHPRLRSRTPSMTVALMHESWPRQARPWEGDGRDYYDIDVDAFYAQAVSTGLRPEFSPRDGSWGERYFHILDPDGHELSFARRI
jgi:hypothetical protein